MDFLRVCRCSERSRCSYSPSAVTVTADFKGNSLLALIQIVIADFKWTVSLWSCSGPSLGYSLLSPRTPPQSWRAKSFSWTCRIRWFLVPPDPGRLSVGLPLVGLKSFHRLLWTFLLVHSWVVYPPPQEVSCLIKSSIILGSLNSCPGGWSPWPINFIRQFILLPGRFLVDVQKFVLLPSCGIVNTFLRYSNPLFLRCSDRRPMHTCSGDKTDVQCSNFTWL